jgi:hypothetical protein
VLWEQIGGLDKVGGAQIGSALFVLALVKRFVLGHVGILAGSFVGIVHIHIDILHIDVGVVLRIRDRHQP